jgi:hypothetical protein
MKRREPKGVTTGEEAWLFPQSAKSRNELLYGIQGACHVTKRELEGIKDSSLGGELEVHNGVAIWGAPLRTSYQMAPDFAHPPSIALLYSDSSL